MVVAKSREQVLEELHRGELKALWWERERERLVLLARERGASWSDIGAALVVTRQAAWERFHEAELHEQLSEAGLLDHQQVSEGSDD